MTQRKMNFAGSFYPNDVEELTRYIKLFNQTKSTLKIVQTPRAMIVPHAGYIYSGNTANMAYSLSAKVKAKRFIVIGPSHRVFLEGASISLYDNYETPLGNLPIDRTYAQALKNKYGCLDFIDEVHAEHSTETQMPFIKSHFGNVSVVEIVYGRIDHTVLGNIIKYLLEDDENFIIISTDLSHFYNLEEANKLDSVCIDGILNKDIDTLNNGCEACGMIGVKGLIQSMIKNNFNVELLQYTTSYEASQDDSRVVGYGSFIIGE